MEAEDYDIGTQNTSYFDNDIGNTGRQYRYDEVDIDKTGDGGYCIGWTDTGEWLEYTVSCKQETAMDIQLRVACTSPGDKIRILLNNQTLATAWLPTTGGWQNWETITIENISVPAGENQILRLEFLGNLFNLDWLNFVKSSGTGINDVNSHELISFYPNPAKDYIQVYANEIFTAEIFNMQGQLLKKKQVSPTDNIIAINELSSGSYVVRIVCGKKVYSEILIVE
jgi:hypothetical protein